MRSNHHLRVWAGLLCLAPLLLAGCSGPDRSVNSGGGASTGNQGIAEGIEGRVTGAGQKPLAGVSVQPRSLDEPAAAIPEMAVASEDDGQYHWSLRPGEYEISFALEGYQPATRKVTVRSREVTRLDVELEPAR
jgi:Carboxypeptidase regulatory-like domain